MEPAQGVFAHRIRAARLGETLVHVYAHRALGFEPGFTETLAFGALRVRGTIEVCFAQNRHVHLRFV